MIQISRSDRSVLATWWFTVDRGLLMAICAIAALGLVLSLAASPAIAVKKGFNASHFLERHVVFLMVGLMVMLWVSMLPSDLARRLSFCLFVLAVAAMGAVLSFGDEVNGAKRWIRFAGASLQPSEFAKPGFVIVVAWGLAQARCRADMPGRGIAITAFLVFAGLLVQQPDVGQTILVAVIFAALLVLAGQPLMLAAIAALAGTGSLVFGYFTLPYVRLRIDRFFSPAIGDNSQAERAIKSFVEGGFFGRGPGEGTIKTVLPDAHTDYLFAVAAEEHGIIGCLVIIALFGFIVTRVFARALDERDDFRRLAACGLALMIGVQALINMAVNVGLVPPKGMTLPLMSAGGSSIVATCITFGLILSLTRRRADPARFVQTSMLRPVASHHRPITPNKRQAIP